MPHLPALVCPLILASVVQAANPVPDAIKPPPDAVPVDTYAATGVQIYRCAPGAPGADARRWTLVAPEAELTDAAGATAHHSAGPTWKAEGGATVLGRVIAQAPAPTPGAIAWLLLAAQTTGTGALAGTRYVQRTNTVGGVAPAGACPTEGAEARIPYAADYAFYR